MWQLASQPASQLSAEGLSPNFATSLYVLQIASLNINVPGDAFCPESGTTNHYLYLQTNNEANVLVHVEVGAGSSTGRWWWPCYLFQTFGAAGTQKNSPRIPGLYTV